MRRILGSVYKINYSTYDISLNEQDNLRDYLVCETAFSLYDFLTIDHMISYEDFEADHIDDD